MLLVSKSSFRVKQGIFLPSGMCIIQSYTLSNSAIVVDPESDFEVKCS